MEQKEFERLFPNEIGVEIMLLNLNMFYNDGFLRVLENMSKGISMRFEYYGYDSPNAFEPYEEEFFQSGIRFNYWDDFQVIDNEKFYRFLKIASEEYIKEHYDLDILISDYMEKIKNNLNLA